MGKRQVARHRVLRVISVFVIGSLLVGGGMIGPIVQKRVTEEHLNRLVMQTESMLKNAQIDAKNAEENYFAYRSARRKKPGCNVGTRSDR